MDFFKHEYAEISLHEGVLFFTYYPIQRFDLEIAQQVVAERMRIQREQSFPILCDMRQVSFPTLEARKYLALQGSLLTTAVAYLVSPHLSESLIRFFIQVNQPPIPTAVFTSKEDALDFLAPFIL